MKIDRYYRVLHFFFFAGSFLLLLHGICSHNASAADVPSAWHMSCAPRYLLINGGAPQLIPPPRHGMCVSTSMSPFHLSRTGNVIEIYAVPAFSSATQPSSPLLRRLRRVFGNSQDTTAIVAFPMDPEDDDTAVMLLVKSPGISSMEAMDVSLGALHDADVDFKKARLSHTESSYTLVVNEEAILVAAGGLSGVHSALSTLEFYQARRTPGHGYNVGFMPAIVIPFDAPRFGWRGWHVDVARHFFSADTLLRAIGKIAALKFNVLHLHLTDDQGWRIHIPKLPRLEKVGSRRARSTSDSPTASISGIFSDDDVRRIVDFCASSGIQIVPEVDFPGHAGAILAAYPDLACEVYLAPVDGVVPRKWGELPYSLCLRDAAATRRSLTFAKTVLFRVAELFPQSTSPYIHLGGDEVPSDVPGYQIVAFFSHLFTFLEEDLAGRRAVVWDEVLAVFNTHGAVKTLRDRRVVVQAWQSGEAVLRALSAGVETVASPMELVYLNYKATPYSLMQSYDPLLLSCTHHDGQPSARLLLGAGACLWSEYVPDETSLLKIAFPRTEALARAFWSTHLHPSDTSDVCASTNMKTHLEYGDEYFGVAMVSDYNDATFFWSEGGASRGDYVAVQILKPYNMACGIKVVTGSKERGHDRCEYCGVSMRVEGQEGMVDVGYVQKDGTLTVRLKDPSNVTAVRLESLRAQHSWLIVRAIEVLPCDVDRGADVGEL